MSLIRFEHRADLTGIDEVDKLVTFHMGKIIRHWIDTNSGYCKYLAVFYRKRNARRFLFDYQGFVGEGEDTEYVSLIEEKYTHDPTP